MKTVSGPGHYQTSHKREFVEYENYSHPDVDLIPYP